MTKSKKKNNTKTVKKSTTTDGKKPVKAVKKAFVDIKPVKILNKKNALEFADYLFSENVNGKNVSVSCVKMCSYSLKENATKNSLSCILGEAYMYFVDPKFSEASLQKEVDHHLSEYYKDYTDLRYSNNEDLVSFILAKNSTCEKDTRTKLQAILTCLPDVNDISYDINIDNDIEYINRAKDVKKAWLKNIVPLLK